MTRVVTHWTAGNYSASSHDLESYHFLVEGDGRLLRGQYSVTDNVGELVWDPRNYAAHARGTNSGAIGISVCSMKDAVEDPFDPGPAPMLEHQWLQMAFTTAELCTRYSIPVSPENVLGHGEVEATLGNPQDGKWDPLALPWLPNLSKPDAGNLFREKVLEFQRVQN